MLTAQEAEKQALSCTNRLAFTWLNGVISDLVHVPPVAETVLDVLCRPGQDACVRR